MKLTNKIKNLLLKEQEYPGEPNTAKADFISAIKFGVKKEQMYAWPWSEQKEPDMKTDIILFLTKNPNPTDEDLHKWAESKKYNIHQVEEYIYLLATKFVKFLIGGRSVKKGITEKDVDSKELKKGIEIEAEHIDDVEVQKRIALDHLAEEGGEKYYKYLEDMEKKMKED